MFAGESHLLLASPSLSEDCFGESRGDCSFSRSRDLLACGVNEPDSSPGVERISASSYWGGDSFESRRFKEFGRSWAI